MTDQLLSPTNPQEIRATLTHGPGGPSTTIVCPQEYDNAAQEERQHNRQRLAQTALGVLQNPRQPAMVEKTQILEEICRLIAEADPDCAAIYREEAPKDFLQPSYLVACVGLDHRNASRWCIGVTARFAVTCLGGAEALPAMQEKALSIFAAGYLSVGDRALPVKAAGGSKTAESTGVDVTLEYLDDRPERREERPLMGTVYTAFAETKGGT